MAGNQERRKLNLKELAAESGLSISTLRRRVKDGSIAVIQAGGSGKKLLFLPTVLDELSAFRATDTPAANTTDDADSDVGPMSHGSVNRGEAGGDREMSESSDCDGDVEQRHSGPRPTWMQSPYFNHINPNN